jgi:hypothetical protein
MCKKFIFSALLFLSMTAHAQYEVHVDDIPRFWTAFDKVIASTDSAEQVKIIQTEYLDKGTAGLKEFNALRDGTAVNYRNFIMKAKSHLIKKRPYTLSVIEQKKLLDIKLAYFKKLYPKLKVGDVFFTIGIGNSGGTTQGNHVLIGCEVAANNAADWAVSLTLHEFVHTQQTMDTAFNLLSQCLMEGAAEFIMELVNQKKIKTISPRGYIAFGLLNEKETWEKFKKVMFAADEKSFGWLYGDPGVEIAGINKVDMGYYIGYRICKSYYDRAKNKQNAILNIIELPYNREKARAFVLASGYVPVTDIAFVKNTAFAKMPESNEGIVKRNYGVVQDENNVIFQYDAPPQLVGSYIDYVVLAGSFNNWNPADSAYKMKLIGKSKYEISISKKQFKKGETYSFKFVLNGKEWLLAPPFASNTDGTGYNNLVFVVD